MKNKQNMNIKEKVKLIAGTIERNDDNTGFNYFEDLIPFFDCPKGLWKKLRTTNVIERVFREKRARK